MKIAISVHTLLLSLALAGCYGSTSTVGAPDAGTDPGSDPVTDAHVDAMPPGECVTDADCVVADPYDCCSGCPLVLARSELPGYACFQERGLPWPDPPPIECLADCFACPVCYPQPLDAVCRAGECVASETGCPGPSAGEIVDASPAEVAAEPLSFDGRTVRMSGSTMARWPACDDWCPGGEDCCQASLYLDGVVRLEGWPCEASLECTADDWCPGTWRCPFFPEGDHYEMTGLVRAGTRWEPPVLEVAGVREIEPVGYGGLYEIRVIAVDVRAEEPGVDCLPGVYVGDTGSLVVADASGDLVVSTPLLGCEEFWGSRDWSAFEAWVPIDCDGCCCDFWIDGSFGEDAITGTYHGWDGICHVEIQFEGGRS